MQGRGRKRQAASRDSEPFVPGMAKPKYFFEGLVRPDCILKQTVEFALDEGERVVILHREWIPRDSPEGRQLLADHSGQIGESAGQERAEEGGQIHSDVQVSDGGEQEGAVMALGCICHL